MYASNTAKVSKVNSLWDSTLFFKLQAAILFELHYKAISSLQNRLAKRWIRHDTNGIIAVKRLANFT